MEDSRTQRVYRVSTLAKRSENNPNSRKRVQVSFPSQKSSFPTLEQRFKDDPKLMQEIFNTVDGENEDDMEHEDGSFLSLNDYRPKFVRHTFIDSSIKNEVVKRLKLHLPLDQVGPATPHQLEEDNVLLPIRCYGCGKLPSKDHMIKLLNAGWTFPQAFDILGIIRMCCRSIYMVPDRSMLMDEITDALEIFKIGARDVIEIDKDGTYRVRDPTGERRRQAIGHTVIQAI